MITRNHNLNLVDEKPSTFGFVRTFLVAATMLMCTLIITGIIAFSCVHGTTI